MRLKSKSKINSTLSKGYATLLNLENPRSSEKETEIQKDITNPWFSSSTTGYEAEEAKTSPTKISDSANHSFPFSGVVNIAAYQHMK